MNDRLTTPIFHQHKQIKINLLRYQLLPPSSPFSLATLPLKFSLEGFAGILKEVPRTLPRGRIWANLINFGSPITIPGSFQRSITFQICSFFSLNYFETRVHPCLSSTSVHIWSRSSSSSHRLASNKLFGHVWVSLCLPSGTSRVCLLPLLSLLRCQTRDCSSPHRAQAAAHWKEDGARRATVGEQLSCDANLWPLNGKLCVSTKSSGGTLALWLW